MYPGVINTQFHHLMYKNNLIKNKAREINNRSLRWIDRRQRIDKHVFCIDFIKKLNIYQKKC